MKLFSKLFAAIAVVALVSCSSDGPDSGQNSYDNLIPYSMDIMGAKSLIVSNGGTRADELGEFQEMGLYKVDANGNISSVGIYMTTDKDGNKLENSVEMRYIPARIAFSSESYIVFEGGRYVSGKLSEKDTNGNGLIDDYEISKDEECSLFVNRNTGKIYRIPQRSLSAENGWFQSDPNTLYRTGELEIWNPRVLVYDDQEYGGYEYHRCVMKYSLNGNILTSTIVGENAAFKNFVCLTSNNVFVSLGTGYNSSFWEEGIGLVWPNGGYDFIDNESCGFYPMPVAFDNATALGVFGNHEDWNDGYQRLSVSYYDVNIGFQPGDVQLNLKAELQGYNTKNFSTFSSETKALSWCNGGIVVYDRNTNEMYVVSTAFNDKEFVFGREHQFNDRQWNLISKGTARGYEVLWINPSTMESGSFDIDLAGIDVSEVQESYTAGQIIFKGTRRADSASVIATVDLATQKTDILFSSFNQISVDYYPLN